MNFKIFFTFLAIAYSMVPKMQYRNCMQGKVAFLEIDPELSGHVAELRETLASECSKISSNVKGCMLKGYGKRGGEIVETFEVRDAFERLSEKCRLVCDCSGLSSQQNGNDDWM